MHVSAKVLLHLLSAMTYHPACAVRCCESFLHLQLRLHIPERNHLLHTLQAVMGPVSALYQYIVLGHLVVPHRCTVPWHTEYCKVPYHASEHLRP
jgi:hypothetical protein